MTKTNVSDMPEEAQEKLAEFGDIVVDDLPNDFHQGETSPITMILFLEKAYQIRQHIG